MSEQTAREIAREIVELKCSHESATSEHLCTCGDIIMWHLERERRENKACKEVILELEAKLKAFEFMTGGGRDDVRYSANKIACLEAEVARLEKTEKAVMDLSHPNFKELQDELTSLKHSLEKAREALREIHKRCGDYDGKGFNVQDIYNISRDALTSPPQAVKENPDGLDWLRKNKLEIDITTPSPKKAEKGPEFTGLAEWIRDQKPIPPEFVKIINDNWWDIVGYEPAKSEREALERVVSVAEEVWEMVDRGRSLKYLDEQPMPTFHKLQESLAALSRLRMKA